MFPDSGDGFSRHRSQMVTYLSRENYTYSSNVLGAMMKVPRHIFVSEALRYRAYEDTSLPIGYGQTISRPSTVARMLQALDICSEDDVLEIGTGSGYQTALLSYMARRVVSMERIQELVRRAQENIFLRLGCRNVTIIHEENPEMISGTFDAIVVAAASPGVPAVLLTLLKPNGVLVVPVKEGKSTTLSRYVKKPSGKIIGDEIGDARFVPLVINS